MYHWRNQYRNSSIVRYGGKAANVRNRGLLNTISSALPNNYDRAIQTVRDGANTRLISHQRAKLFRTARQLDGRLRLVIRINPHLAGSREPFSKNIPSFKFI